MSRGNMQSQQSTITVFNSIFFPMSSHSRLKYTAGYEYTQSSFLLFIAVIYLDTSVTKIVFESIMLIIGIC